MMLSDFEKKILTLLSQGWTLTVKNYACGKARVMQSATIQPEQGQGGGFMFKPQVVLNLKRAGLIKSTDPSFFSEKEDYDLTKKAQEVL